MKEFYCKKNISKINSFKEDIKRYANQKNLDFQETEDSEIEWMCQLKKDSKFTLSVASRAVTIVIQDFSDDTIKISVGEGKWASKITGTVVTSIASGGLFLIAAPVTVTGIAKQVKLIKDIQNFIKINF